MESVQPSGQTHGAIAAVPVAACRTLLVLMSATWDIVALYVHKTVIVHRGIPARAVYVIRQALYAETVLSNLVSSATTEKTIMIMTSAMMTAHSHTAETH